ncbi:MAG: MFS transporter [Phenylobacterium sp.]|uniref:MFS transporter n=1 Tax=Phenylobacterium sp. TaxID=1871053 RepID=UPI0025DD5BF3|nr:MFS transporter [Phenylobacterium sp.]MBI1199761.1 MFS transporter [Phenylobacterium sp.]
MRRLILSAGALRFLDSAVLILPFYTVMFAEHGLSPAQIGVILAAWSVTGVVLEAPSGVLADRVSRRWLLATAQAVRCLGFGVWLAFPGFWGFLVGLMLWGLKSATLSGAFEAVIYDELKALGREADYARVIGRTQSARFAGVMTAALGAAPLAAFGYPTLIWISIGTGLAAAVSALALPEAPRAVTVGRFDYVTHLRRGVMEAASLPGVPGLLAFIASMQAVVWAVADYWQIFGQQVGLPKSGIALFMAALSGVGAITAALAHRLRGLRPVTFCMLYALAGACVVAGAATWRTWSIVLPMAYVALYWTVDINADARFQHALRSETRATVASLKGFIMQCGTSLLMLAFGLIAQAASYRAAFLASGLTAMAIGGGFAVSTLRRPGTRRERGR